LPIAELEKVCFYVPKHNVGALRKYIFKLSDFHPLELNHNTLGDFATLKDRLERVVSLGSKRKPDIYATSVLSEKETISTGYIEIGPVLSEIERLIDEHQLLTNELNNLNKQILGLEPFQWVSAPWEDSHNWHWIKVALVKKSKAVLKILSDLPVAFAEGDNGIVVAYYKDDDETAEVIREYALDDRLLTHIGRELNELKIKKERLTKHLADVESQLDTLLEENGTQIRKAFDYYSVSLEYARLVNGSVDTQFLGVVVGYLPKEHLNDALKEVRALGGDVLQLPPEEDEMYPTKLENSSFFEPYESITLMYGPPRYDTYDPTPAVALWWNLFFAFMLGDAGFGLIITLVSLYGLKKIKSMEKILRLCLNVGVGTMIIGIITWSWFSTQPLMINGKALGLFYPVNGSDVNTMLVISLVIGVMAQFYAMGIKGWWMLRNKDYLGFWSDVFCWWGFLSSLIWLLLGGGSMSTYLALFFAINLILFQGRESKNWISRLGMGLIGLYGIISPYGVASFLGDVLSYSRLMALNLTGALMGQVFNSLSFGVMKSGLMGIVFGVLMFVVFQVFNFAISALGAFVHSIRLVFLEMYGRFYEGNGELFKPLRRVGRYYRFEEVEYE